MLHKKKACFFVHTKGEFHGFYKFLKFGVFCVFCGSNGLFQVDGFNLRYALIST
jgi:hypothetical protein